VIERVKLVNFLSHESTEIVLGEGLTIFIGRNGAGKSSVIDAITYALYGRHTRSKKEKEKGEMRAPVRYGSGWGRVELDFRHLGKKYEVVREFDGKGSLRTAVIREKGRLLVTGAKRGDINVSEEVSRILRMNYDRMVSSVVIQQGEIDTILKSQPKELKELFDDLMGLRAFDEAYKNMKDILDGFEERIKKETGRYPRDADSAEQELEGLKKEVENAKAKERALAEMLRKKEAELKEITERIERAEELIRLNLELEGVLNKLKERIRGEIRWLEKRASELKGHLKTLSIKEEIEAGIKRLKEREEQYSALKEREKVILDQLKEIEEELKALPTEPSGAKSLDELRGEARRRAERLRDDSMELGKALARGQTKLDLYELQEKVERDVESVVDLVSETYTSAMALRAYELMRKRKELQDELNNVRQQKERTEKEIKDFKILEGQDVTKLHAQVLTAEQEVMSAGGKEGAKSLVEKLEGLKAKHAKLAEVESSLELEPEVLDGLDALLSDEEVLRMTSRLKEGIATLKDSSFSVETVSELEKLRKRKEELSREIGQIEGELGGLQAIIEEKSKRAEELEKNLRVLKKAKEFYSLMRKVRDEVYHRDGPVLKGLRGWIYEQVSERAREYLDMFDSNVDDVKIEEKGDSVVFTCYHSGRELGWEWLSGGEKVVLALALRLAIGDVLGAQRLRFFILDEPTVHLDSEKRMRLRDVLVKLSQKMPQVIVITHDEEIFEGSEARVLRFEKEGGATRVVEVGRQAIGG
jgi:exonuclease SbcC